VEHLDIVPFNSQEQNYFSRSPTSSEAEAIIVKGDFWNLKVAAYVSALLASGFKKTEYSQNNRSFTPCPLGTFTNPSTKGTDGCQNCTPGNFLLLFSIP